MKRALIVGLGAIGSAVCQFSLIRLYGQRFDSSDISVYLIFRLWSVFVFSLASLGMPIAMQRTVAYWSDAPRRAGTAALTGLAISLTSLLICLSLSATYAQWIVSSVHAASAVELWRAFMVMTFLQTMTGMIGFVQQARGRTMEATIVAFLWSGAVPVAVFALAPTTLGFAPMLRWTGVISAIVGLPSLVELIVWTWRNGASNPATEARLLLKYGLPRSLASSAEVLLEASVPWILMRMGAPLDLVGALAVGLTIVRFLNPLSFTLNQLLVPSSALLAARNDHAKQRGLIEIVAQSAVHVGLFAAVQAILWCDVVVRYWDRTDIAGSLDVVRVTVATIAPVLVFVSLRGILDGALDSPINTMNLLGTLVGFIGISLVVWWLQLSASLVVWAYLLSRVVLAWLSLRATFSIQHVKWTSLELPVVTGWVVLLGVLVAFGRLALFPKISLVGALLGASVATVMFVLLMARAKSSWALMLLHRRAPDLEGAG